MRISDWSSDVCSSDLIDAVEREEKLHAAGGLIGRGSRHGDQAYRGFLALELIDRADADAARQARPQRVDLRVIGGDYDDVAGADRARGAVLVGPAPLQEILDCRADRRNFLGGDLGIAFVDDRHPEGTGRGPGRSGNALALGIAMAGQASLVD